MIIDNLKNCGLYYGTHKRFESAFDFIKKAEAENLEIGKYEIDGKNLYAIVQEYTTKLPEDAKFETHKNYIDIQYIISGREEMEVCDLSRAEATTEYNGEKDVQFFVPKAETTKLTMQAGDYAIFFPDDIHMPGVSPKGENVAVKKIVAKVRIK